MFGSPRRRSRSPLRKWVALRAFFAPFAPSRETTGLMAPSTGSGQAQAAGVPLERGEAGVAAGESDDVAIAIDGGVDPGPISL